MDRAPAKPSARVTRRLGRWASLLLIGASAVACGSGSETASNETHDDGPTRVEPTSDPTTTVDEASTVSTGVEPTAPIDDSTAIESSATVDDSAATAPDPTPTTSPATEEAAVATTAGGGPAAPRAEVVATSLVGLSVEDAEAAAHDAGYRWRIEALDGERYDLGQDYDPERLNATVVGGVVTEVRIG